MRGALWGLRQSHSVNYANHQHSPFARQRHDFRQVASRRFKLHFPRYRLVKVSWESVQPFPRTVVSYFLRTEKKTKNKKTSVKHICYRLIGGCINYFWLTNICQNAKFGRHLKPRQSYYDWKNFSTAVLTLTFDLTKVKWHSAHMITSPPGGGNNFTVSRTITRKYTEKRIELTENKTSRIHSTNNIVISLYQFNKHIINKFVIYKQWRNYWPRRPRNAGGPATYGGPKNYGINFFH